MSTEWDSQIEAEEEKKKDPVGLDITKDEDAELTAGLGLTIPNVATAVEEKKPSKKVEPVAEAIAQSGLVKFNDVDQKDIDFEGADIEETRSKHIMSRDHTEQLMQREIRSVYIEEEGSIRFPCVIIDFTHTGGIRAELLKLIKEITYDAKDMSLYFEGEEQLAAEEFLNTYVYTKSATKLTLIGKFNMASSFYILERALSTSGLTGKVELLVGENGELRKYNKSKQQNYAIRL